MRLMRLLNFLVGRIFQYVGFILWLIGWALWLFGWAFVWLGCWVEDLNYGG
jgi:hypothetical protein